MTHRATLHILTCETLRAGLLIDYPHWAAESIQPAVLDDLAELIDLVRTAKQLCGKTSRHAEKRAFSKIKIITMPVAFFISVLLAGLISLAAWADDGQIDPDAVEPDAGFVTLEETPQPGADTFVPLPRSAMLNQAGALRNSKLAISNDPPGQDTALVKLDSEKRTDSALADVDSADVDDEVLRQGYLSQSQVRGNEMRVDANLARDLAKRLADVEKKLKSREDADKKAADAAARKFTVRPFGRIHMDAVSFNQSDANRAVVGDAKNGVDIRRARLGVEGEGFDTFFYRFDVDFVTFDQSTQKRPTIFDAYLDTQNLPVLKNVRVGHFREPFSLERLDSTHDLPFMERTAAINMLTPFRNVGVMPFGWNDDETVTWAYGVFAENTNEFGEQVSDRTGLAFTTRVTMLPWYDEHAEGRYLWHVGASYSYRNLSNPLRQFAQVPEIQLKEDSTNRTPNWVNTGALSINDYHVMGLETTSVLGSLSIQGEYVGLFANQTNGDIAYLHGGYLEAMYFLTGENRNYNRKQGIFGAVTPHSNFFRVKTDNGIETGSGAWEVGARVSNVDLISGSVHGGEMLNMTFGLNWYYAVRSRVMFNYIHSFLDRGGVDSTADMFATRFQFAF